MYRTSIPSVNCHWVTGDVQDSQILVDVDPRNGIYSTSPYKCFL